MSKTKPKVRKNTHIPKEPIYLYVSYESKCINVTEDTLGSDGPYSGFREDDWDYTLSAVYTRPPVNITADYDYARLRGATKIPDKVWVLYVRYSTGDTFSHSHGRGAVVNVYATQAQARKDQKLIEEGKYKYSGTWTGYFEQLEGTGIEELEVTII